MRKNSFDLKIVEPWPEAKPEEWLDWKWQLRHSLKSKDDFQSFFQLNENELNGFAGLDKLFRVQTTPYYASLMDPANPDDPIRQMIMPNEQELTPGWQQMADPLGENKQSNRPCERLIHRYTDRALFLVTDICGVYCRYCTRKHFTASDQVMASKKQVEEVVDYLKKHPEVKEVIFSGGDPLTLSNNKLEEMLVAIDSVESVELIRIGSRLPVVNPMRIDDELVELFHRYRPVYMMTHFNHPDEITKDSAEALERLVDRGVPVFNQLVLLNGINNDPALIYALSRRLLALRVKPHYMFQADPSLGTDHLRTSIEDSLEIQKQLWGHTSGLAMPTFIVDIPDGGGKTALTPDFVTQRSFGYSPQDDCVGHPERASHPERSEGSKNKWSFKGWDGVEADYINPATVKKPKVAEKYRFEFK